MWKSFYLCAWPIAEIMRRRGRTYYWRLFRYVFDALKLRKFQATVKDLAAINAVGILYRYASHLYAFTMLTAWGFVARFYSCGYCEDLRAWNGQNKDSTLFLLLPDHGVQSGASIKYNEHTYRWINKKGTRTARQDKSLACQTDQPHRRCLLPHLPMPNYWHRASIHN